MKGKYLYIHELPFLLGFNENCSAICCAQYLCLVCAFRDWFIVAKNNSRCKKNIMERKANKLSLYLPYSQSALKQLM